MGDTVGASDNKPQRAKLWREGLRLFRAHWREWAKLAVWFFIVMAILEAAMFRGILDSTNSDVMQQISAAQKAKQDLTPEQQAALRHMTWVGFAWMVPFLLATVVQMYAFIVFFMKKQPGIGLPAFSVAGFFRWMWAYVKLVVLLAALGAVVIGVPVGFGLVFAKSQPVLKPIAIIAGLAGLVFLYFIMLRLVLVLILAVGDIKPLFKTSWQIMKGNCWRLFGNTLLLMLIVLGFWIVIAIVEFFAGICLTMAAKSLFAHAADSVQEQIKFYIHAVFSALNLTIFGGFVQAFYCAATRVLYQEYNSSAAAQTAQAG